MKVGANLHVVWSVATVAQFVGNPMGPMQQHVLVEMRGSLDLRLEGPTCDSAYQHLFSLEADDVYCDQKKVLHQLAVCRHKPYYFKTVNFLL
jgi:hypothetical protein